MNLHKSLGTTNNTVARLYQTVIDDVANNTREIFLDEGVDESTIQLFKQTWENKVAQTRAVEATTLGASRQQSSMPFYVFSGNGIPGNSKDNTASSQVFCQGRLPAIQSNHIQLTSPATQASMGLPNNIIYNRDFSTIGRPAVFTYGKPKDSNTATAVISKPVNDGKAQESDSNSNPTSLIQVDGGSDCVTLKNKNKLSLSAKQSDVVDEASTSDACVTIDTKKKKILIQLDGTADDSSSSSEEDEEDDDEDDDDEEDEDDEDDESEDKNEVKKQEEPELGSDDDVSTDEDPTELFDTENVVVCQYDKIHRTKCRWKFNLKVGIMNLNGKDHVFQKATGEANW